MNNLPVDTPPFPLNTTFNYNSSEDQIESEIEMQKRRFENELGVNLRVAALNTIEEIEKLMTNLNNAIKKWKIENL